jgi:hypothetical protein
MNCIDAMSKRAQLFVLCAPFVRHANEKWFWAEMTTLCTHKMPLSRSTSRQRRVSQTIACTNNGMIFGSTQRPLVDLRNLHSAMSNSFSFGRNRPISLVREGDHDRRSSLMKRQPTVPNRQSQRVGECTPLREDHDQEALFA